MILKNILLKILILKLTIRILMEFSYLFVLFYNQVFKIFSNKTIFYKNYSPILYVLSCYKWMYYEIYRKFSYKINYDALLDNYININFFNQIINIIYIYIYCFVRKFEASNRYRLG